jgi:hypothetical protein
MSESTEAKAHDYPLYGFDLTWRNGAYYVSVPNLLEEGERLHVVPATALHPLETEIARLKNTLSLACEEAERKGIELGRSERV